MTDPLDDNKNAPDDALLGPGSTATGGGTAQDATGEPDASGTSAADGDSHIRPLDPDAPAQLADDRFRHADL